MSKYRSKFYFKAKYISDEFPCYFEQDILVADDKKRIGYIFLFQDGQEFDMMHDDDYEFIERLDKKVEDWQEYYEQNKTSHL